MAIFSIFHKIALRMLMIRPFAARVLEHNGLVPASRLR
jgi:hypothetical protein